MEGTKIVKDQHQPRNGVNASDDGAYDQVIKLINPVINPGDVVEVEQYLTGYGNITGAKLGFYPNIDVYEADKSSISYNLKEEHPEFYNFGGIKHQFKNTGVNIGLTGLGLLKEDWAEQQQGTLFFDVSEAEPPQILTEMKLKQSPFKYELKTNSKIRPGIYSLEFYFTYHDGSCWNVSMRKTEFKVRNFFERNDVVIGFIAILASVSALVRLALYPLIIWLIEVLKPLLE
ncbi:hypothetical protein OH966_002942 [Vibrio parahaemolyticus]|nr:hypothetical protein [Vibrio parahaemolyticus]EJZ3822055.1 hypothetical protein [Vibrio parahaemolyticus]